MGKKIKGFPLILLIITILMLVITVNELIVTNSKENSELHINKDTHLSVEELNEKLIDGKLYGISYSVKKDTLQLGGEHGKRYIVTDVYADFKEGKIKDYRVDKAITESIRNYRTGPISKFVVWLIIAVILQISYGRIVTMVEGKKDTKTSESKEEIKVEIIPRVKLKDVRGHDEIIEDIKTIIEFIKSPLKYEAMGARLPKGAILFGPPGTGKTLLAKAIAGESGVSFIEASGSDFVEKYVGVGAKRVRELFAEARKNSPCIIFIDEIDAVGRARGAEEGNSERDSTLNALLTEIDGFTPGGDIFVLASTNKIELLDSALIRAGRFDKHIAVGLPDVKGRRDILGLYAKNKPLDKDIDLDELSKLTTSFSGAELESLLNEAAILAVRNGRNKVKYEDIDKALYSIQLKGYQKKDYKRSREENLLVAYHEAGHTIASLLLSEDEVTKVTIIPSTSGAGGVTFTNPKDATLLSKTELENNIRMLYAGRAAELLLTGCEDKVTTGAHNDIERATNMIYRMVTEYGMYKDFGVINMNIFKGTSNKVEKKVSELSIKYYNETVEFIQENENILRELAQELILEETLHSEQIKDIVEKNTCVSVKRINTDKAEGETQPQTV